MKNTLLLLTLTIFLTGCLSTETNDNVVYGELSGTFIMTSKEANNYELRFDDMIHQVDFEGSLMIHVLKNDQLVNGVGTNFMYNKKSYQFSSLQDVHHGSNYSILIFFDKNSNYSVDKNEASILIKDFSSLSTGYPVSFTVPFNLSLNIQSSPSLPDAFVEQNIQGALPEEAAVDVQLAGTQSKVSLFIKNEDLYELNSTGSLTYFYSDSNSNYAQLKMIYEGRSYGTDSTFAFPAKSYVNKSSEQKLVDLRSYLRNQAFYIPKDIVAVFAPEIVENIIDVDDHKFDMSIVSEYYDLEDETLIYILTRDRMTGYNAVVLYSNDLGMIACVGYYKEAYTMVYYDHEKLESTPGNTVIIKDIKTGEALNQIKINLFDVSICSTDSDGSADIPDYFGTQAAFYIDMDDSDFRIELSGKDSQNISIFQKGAKSDYIKVENIDSWAYFQMVFDSCTFNQAKGLAEESVLTVDGKEYPGVLASIYSDEEFRAIEIEGRKFSDVAGNVNYWLNLGIKYDQTLYWEDSGLLYKDSYLSNLFSIDPTFNDPSIAGGYLSIDSDDIGVSTRYRTGNHELAYIIRWDVPKK